MPRGQVRGEDGCSRECHSVLLPRYKRLTGSAGALIAGAYLAGVNTGRFRPTPKPLRDKGPFPRTGQPRFTAV